MPVRFLDTNIRLRYLTRDDEKKAASALALLRRIEQREETVATSQLVIFETVFTLQKTYRISRTQIRDALSDIISLRGVELPNKPIYLRALDLYAEKNISFADVYNAAYMQAHHLNEIYSFDTDFDKIDGITRVEPAGGPTSGSER
jgi:predicted nucleic acid-binding protein